MKRKIKLKKFPMLIILIMIFVPVITILFLANSNLSKDIVAEEPVVEEYYEETLPVVTETEKFINPYYESEVKVGKSFYDYKGEEKSQEESLIVSENTYYQNTGIDYVSAKVFDVISIKNGTVLNVKEDDITGKIVEIKHDDEIVSVYQSLSEVTVKKGDIINQGQLIGKSGTNKLDQELGNHLHLEIYKNGNSVNPENYLNKEYIREN